MKENADNKKEKNHSLVDKSIRKEVKKRDQRFSKGRILLILENRGK